MQYQTPSCIFHDNYAWLAEKVVRNETISMIFERDCFFFYLFSTCFRALLVIKNDLTCISINLLVVYRESVNLIGYITVHYQLIAYGKTVARVIVYLTLFQARISTDGANGAPRLNLMKHNETVLFYALLDIFFSFMQ